MSQSVLFWLYLKSVLFKSNQNQFYLYNPQITICTVKVILCPLALDSSEEKKQKMEETSGRATEEGSISQDRQTCNRCHMYRTEQQNDGLQSVARVTQPPLHCGDLEECRQHKIISKKKENIEIKRHQI